jgi:hypothetical protein
MANALARKLRNSGPVRRVGRLTWTGHRQRLNQQGGGTETQIATAPERETKAEAEAEAQAEAEAEAET